jgi:hypothetical protein
MFVALPVVSVLLGPRMNRGRSLEAGPPKKIGLPAVSSTVWISGLRSIRG